MPSTPPVGCLCLGPQALPGLARKGGVPGPEANYPTQLHSKPVGENPLPLEPSSEGMAEWVGENQLPPALS